MSLRIYIYFLIHRAIFILSEKERCRLYRVKIFMNWLLRKKDCSSLQCRQSGIPAGRGWMTQENHSGQEGTKSRHPAAVNLMDWRLCKCGWEGLICTNSFFPPVVSWGTFTEVAAMFLLWEESPCFLPPTTLPMPCSTHGDDICCSDKGQYIPLWHDVISLLAIFLNVCQKDMKS